MVAAVLVCGVDSGYGVACQFGAKRLAEFVSTRIESVAPTNLRGCVRDKEAFTFGSGAADAAVASGDSGNVGAAGGDGDFGFGAAGAGAGD